MKTIAYLVAAALAVIGLVLAGTAAGLTFLPDARAWSSRATPPAPAGDQPPAGAPRPGV